MATWHESDVFWATTAPMMFGAERWRAAPAEVARAVRLLASEPRRLRADLDSFLRVPYFSLTLS